ncbi:MAG TPA: hypothetical protein VIT38_02465 [Allosphingosinicella sp.]
MIWGALHGTILAGERLWREFRPKDWRALPQILGVLVTFHIVTLGWIFFRAASFPDALAYLGGFGGGGSALLTTPLMAGLVLIGMSFHFTPPHMIQKAGMRVRAMPAIPVGLAAGALILIVDAMRPEGVAPFIYYQF